MNGACEFTKTVDCAGDSSINGLSDEELHRLPDSAWQALGLDKQQRRAIAQAHAEQ